MIEYEAVRKCQFSQRVLSIYTTASSNMDNSLLQILTKILESQNFFFVILIGVKLYFILILILLIANKVDILSYMYWSICQMSGRRWSSFCSRATSSGKPSLITLGRLCESNSLEYQGEYGYLCLSSHNNLFNRYLLTVYYVLATMLPSRLRVFLHSSSSWPTIATNKHLFCKWMNEWVDESGDEKLWCFPNMETASVGWWWEWTKDDVGEQQQGIK